MKWIARIVIALAVLALAAAAAFKISVARAPEPLLAAALPPPPPVDGDNGLSDADRSTFYHLSEGGEIYPLDWLLALEVETGTRDGRPEVRPFLDNIERYGMLPDSKGPGNPVRAAGRRQLRAVENLRHADDRPQLHGLPRRADSVSRAGVADRRRTEHALINKFLQDLGVETQATLDDAGAARSVLAAREATRGTPAGPRTPTTHGPRALWQRVTRVLTQDRGLLQARVDAMRNDPDAAEIARHQHARRLRPARRVRHRPRRAVRRHRREQPARGRAGELSAHLGHEAHRLAAVGRQHQLGDGAQHRPGARRRRRVRSADVQEHACGSTICIALETLAYRLDAPPWPAFFPPIDQAKAARGQQHFTKYCAGCHETWPTDGQMRDLPAVRAPGGRAPIR